MDYTNEILERLQKGEAIEDIAAKLTEDLNTANEQYKAAKAKAEAEAAAKAKQDNLFAQKVEAVEAVLFAFEDLLALYEVDEEILNTIEEADPEEIVKVIDESIPFLTKYIELNQELEALKDKGQKVDGVSLKAAVHAADPIEDFLNQMVR
jgi:hypothetical protein